MNIDPTAIPGAIAAAADLVSKLADRITKTQDKDQSKEIIELMQKLLEIQVAVSALLEKNRDMEARLSESETQDQIERELVPDREVYWWTKDGKRDGPYCKVCWHRDRKRTQLMSMASQGSYECAICKGSFHSSEYKARSSFYGGGIPRGEWP